MRCFRNNFYTIIVYVLFFFTLFPGTIYGNYPSPGLDSLVTLAKEYEIEKKWNEAACIYYEILDRNACDEMHESELLQLLTSVGFTFYMAEIDSLNHIAEKYINKALTLSKEQQDSLYLSTNLLNLGRLKRYTGKLDDSRKLFLRAKEISKTYGYTKNNAVANKYLGMICMSENKYDKAASYLQEAIASASKFSSPVDLSEYYRLLGLIFRNDKEYNEAINAYISAIAFFPDTISSEKINIVSWVYQGIIQSYRALGQYENAILKAKEAYSYLKDHPEKASLFGELLGDINNYDLGKFNYANDWYKKSLANRNQIDLKDRLLVFKMANAWYNFGQFDTAYQAFSNALELAEQAKDTALMAKAGLGLGDIYIKWSAFRKAELAFEKAFYLDSVSGLNQYSKQKYFNRGMLSQYKGDYKQSFAFYNSFLSEEDLTKGDSILVLNNIGLIYKDLDQFDSAISYLKKSVNLADENDDYPAVKEYSNIGYCYFLQKEHSKAEKYLQKAIKLSGKFNLPVNESTLISLGLLYTHMGNYEQSAYYLKKYIQHAEKIRQTAQGDLRRESMARANQGYQFLTRAYAMMNNADSAFMASEMGSSRYVLDKVSGEDEFQYSSSFYKSKKSQCIIRFTNLTFLNTVRIVLTGDSVHLVRTPLDSLKLNKETIENRNKDFANYRRGANMVQGSSTEDKLIHAETVYDRLPAMIRTYRELLSQPGKREQAIQLSRQLYDYLFGSMAHLMQGKDELVIMPEGELFLLPFETLITPSGKRLSELYTIRYVPSLAVLNTISNREYSDNRKYLLAFGGADYKGYHNSSVFSAKPDRRLNLQELQKAIDTCVTATTNMSFFYANSGITGWSNLPGTRKEIVLLDSIFSDKPRLMITGKDVKESFIKKLSELNNYRIIHFAAHGITIPGLPELSALVLSPENDGANEGYLRAPEIENLNIHADLVNLSACKTGLGKIYEGEGMVGLTQAFLIAGANGVLVSLWEIDDKSTAIFMEKLYQLVMKGGMSFHAAVNQTKICFMKGEFGEKYSDPYYWGPFVYFGN